MHKASLYKKKICLLGPFAVGKTSIVERFVYSRFDDKYLTTLGVKVSQKLMPPLRPAESNRFIQFTFLIWDIAGMEKFDAIVKNYYRGAAGALAVADLTRPETAPLLQNICDKFLSVNPSAPILILGNKLDIFDEDKQTIHLLEETASRFSTEYVLTSAKTGAQVEAAFLKLAEKMTAL